jgi:hypothetical protein
MTTKIPLRNRCHIYCKRSHKQIKTLREVLPTDIVITLVIHNKCIRFSHIIKYTIMFKQKIVRYILFQHIDFPRTKIFY